MAESNPVGHRSVSAGHVSVERLTAMNHLSLKGRGARGVQAWAPVGLVLALTKSYTQFVAELITHLRRSDRSMSGDALEQMLRSQQSESRHWPDDQEVRHEMQELQVYRRFSQARVRMVLEALEDDLRGWRGSAEGLGGERVERRKRAIEHSDAAQVAAALVAGE